MDNGKESSQQGVPAELEIQLTPKQAILLVVLSIVFVVLFGTFARVILESVFGKSEWHSPFLLIELLIIVPSIVILKKYRYSFKTIFRFNPVSLSVVFWSVIFGFSVTIIGDQLDRIIQAWFPMPDVLTQAMEEIFLTPNSIDFFLILIIATLGAGFCEEMLFRGLLQNILEKKFNLKAAIFIPAFLFGLIHFLPWLVIQITLLGLALGVLAWRCDSIYPTILVHSLNNLIAILYIRFHSPELDSLYVSESLVNPTFVLLAIVVFLFSGRQIWNCGRLKPALNRDSFQD